MKQIVFFLSLIAIGLTSFSQTKGFLQYDSLYVQRTGGNAELILINKTRDTIGFLFNKGGGRTEFRRVLKTLNDSTYLIGGDTLQIKNTAALNSYTDVFNGTTVNQFTLRKPPVTSSIAVYVNGQRVLKDYYTLSVNTVQVNTSLLSFSTDTNDKIEISYQSKF